MLFYANLTSSIKISIRCLGTKNEFLCWFDCNKISLLKYEVPEPTDSDPVMPLESQHISLTDHLHLN